MVGSTGPTILSTRVFTLLFLLTSSVASVAGKRSGHHEQTIASLRNEDVGLDAENDLDDVPEECQGEDDANKLERCIEGYYMKQTLLAQFNIENIPEECEKEEANKLEDCMTNWDLEQVILGLSDTKIPPECEELKKVDKLIKCIEQNTLSPTPQPSGAPTTSPTKLPTKSPTLQHSSLTQPPSEEFVFTTSSLKDVILDIGEFVMSLTTYSQTSREMTNNDFLSRQYELKAARQHLREVYEDIYKIPVSSVDLEFIDSGVTTLSKSDSMIRHSIFSGNVTFIEDATNVMPTVAQLESDTLKAFLGPQKEEFIKIYHFLATGNLYFGVKYRYDVNVRKLINNNINNINKGEVGNIATQELQGMGGTGNDAVGTSGMFIGLMIVLAFVVVGTLFGLVVLVRRRKLDRVPSSQEISYDDGFDVEEVNVTGSKVGSDVSLSPIQMVEEVSRHSSENISHLGIDLSVASDDDEKPKVVDDMGEIVSSSWNLDDLRQENAYVDVELEIGSQCQELISGEKKPKD